MSTASIAAYRDRRAFVPHRVHPPRTGFVLRLLAIDRWSLEGDLDCMSAPMLLPVATASLPGPAVLYVECDAVEFIDVAGWRALHSVRMLLEPGTELRLCHPSGALRRLIAVIGHP